MFRLYWRYSAPQPNRLFRQSYKQLDSLRTKSVIMRRSFTNIISLLIGSALGILGGILLAPDSGSTTRSMITYQLRRMRNNLQELIKELVLFRTNRAATSQAKIAGQEVVDQTIARARQLLSEANELVDQLAD